MTMIRRVTRIEWEDGSFLNLPRYEFDQEETQELHISAAALVGANYDYDLLGAASAPKRNRMVRLAFTILGQPYEINQTLDELRQRFYEGALLRLWNEGADTDDHDDVVSTRRWMDARVEAQPHAPRPVESKNQRMNVNVTLSGYSDWAAEDETVLETAITTDPQEVTLVLAGTAPIFDAVVELRGTFSDPVTITNQTNTYRLRQTRSGSGDNDRLRWRAGVPAVERSTDGGSTWTGDYANFARRPGQVQLMVLRPGSNVINVEGVSNGTLTIRGYPRWH